MFHAPLLKPCRYLLLKHADFMSQVKPRPLLDPKLFHLNHSMAGLLGLDESHFTAAKFCQALGDAGLPTSIIGLATAYSGHQFGQFNPALGDGRAMLVGEIPDQSGKRWEIQLKGSGPTPYSRGFDGRAVMRSVIREYLASEAMNALGIPSTRALCIVSSQTPVFREQPENGALMIRCAESHIRFGNFEHFFARGQMDRLQELVDFCIKQYFPDLTGDSKPYEAWFAEIVQRTARLIAQWQATGFCHGVMNTDNFSILGLTLDYGPYGFLESYQPTHICNHSDDAGRYAYARQPAIAYWNCMCLARALSPLIDQPVLEQALAQFEPELQASYLTLMRNKLGITGSEDTEADEKLITALMSLLEQQKMDYSRFFRGLGYWLDGQDYQSWLYQEGQQAEVDIWLMQYRQRIQKLADGLSVRQRAERMASYNPKYILRNYLAQQVIAEAEKGSATTLDDLLCVLQAPYDEHEQHHVFAESRPDGVEDLSVSCSS